ncbi:DoxX family protein [Corynebacterium sphenisci]|uniref:DoxX family protein n=1 Tax=Corynebacterium sphenisci TaxID=191493 RepID=UPI0026E0E9F1|nr:DoxX family protein [Corynebacterium sphenisci]MDO5731326.1 DoxX family protein [Corynebacterium sphenisci]
MKDNDDRKPDNAYDDLGGGLDDDLDVPVYRRLADDGTAPEGDGGGAPPEAPAPAGGGAAAPRPGPEEPADPAGQGTAEAPLDPYAATGRAAPQVIEPRYAPAEAEAPTEYLAAADPEATRAAPAAAPAPAADAPTEVAAAPAPAAPAAEGAGTAVAEPAAPAEDDFLEEEPDPRRGTLDLGLLLLRLGVGGMLLLHGLTTFFGFGGAPGIGALQSSFADAAWNVPEVMAVAVPTVEVIAGGLLVLGLATPLGAALALVISAFLTMAAVAMSPGGWNIAAGEGAEAVRLQLLLTAGALALQFTGPGRYGLDATRGWARRPLASSWIFCLIAIAAAVALWWLITGTLPFVGSTTVTVG